MGKTLQAKQVFTNSSTKGMKYRMCLYKDTYTYKNAVLASRCKVKYNFSKWSSTYAGQKYNLC